MKISVGDKVWSYVCFLALVVFLLLSFQLYTIYSMRQERVIRERIIPSEDGIINPSKSLNQIDKSILIDNSEEDCAKVPFLYGPFAAFYYDLYMANACNSSASCFRIEKEIANMYCNIDMDDDSRWWIQNFKTKLQDNKDTLKGI